MKRPIADVKGRDDGKSLFTIKVLHCCTEKKPKISQSQANSARSP